MVDGNEKSCVFDGYRSECNDITGTLNVPPAASLKLISKAGAYIIIEKLIRKCRGRLAFCKFPSKLSNIS